MRTYDTGSQQSQSSERLNTLPAALQLDVQRREGLHANHVVHDACCVGVVCAIVKLLNGAGWVLEALIPAKGVSQYQLYSRSAVSFLHHEAHRTHITLH